MSGVNLAGALLLGDQAETTSVQIGAGGVLTVSNTTASPSVSVSGTLVVASLSSASAIQAPNLSASAPGLIFSAADTSTGFNSAGAGTVGFYSGGAERLSFGASQVSLLTTLATGTNALSCGALTCGALASGAVTVSGTASCGTNAMTCGALSCTSIVATGNIVQQQYSLRLVLSTAVSISTSTNTAIVWDTVETTGGGAVGWPITVPTSTITIPINGFYEVTYTGVYTGNSSGSRDFWFEINPTGGPGSSRRYGETTAAGFAGGNWAQNGCFCARFSAGDTLVGATYQSSGGSIAILSTTQGTPTAVQITWLYP